MDYHTYGKRCAVDLESLEMRIPKKQIITILSKKGFKAIDVDMVSLARQCIERSKYQRGANPFKAPTIVDCSSFMMYLYGCRGIELPRRSIQQRTIGELVKIENIMTGDLVFVSGHIDYYEDDPADGVGHVGIATDEGTVIHAANKKSGVIESTFDSFIEGDKFRGIRRYIPSPSNVLTFEIPANRYVSSSDDFKWIIRQSL